MTMKRDGQDLEASTPPRLVNTIREMAKLLGVTELTIRRRIKAGTLRGVQIGGSSWRLPGANKDRIYELPVECTPHQVAMSLEVSDLTVLRWIKGGKLSAEKRGRAWYVQRNVLENILWDSTSHSVSSDAG